MQTSEVMQSLFPYSFVKFSHFWNKTLARNCNTPGISLTQVYEMKTGSVNYREDYI